MDNNDILIRLRYALDMKDEELVKIFKLGGVDVPLEDVKKMLTKSQETYQSEEKNNSYIRELEDHKECTNKMLDAFLNGFITYKRGPQDSNQKSDQPDIVLTNKNVNNIMLKKVKIALRLTSEDLLDIFNKAGITVTKGELSAVLRREGQRNYKECGDRYARNFLKGLAIKFRK